jgi:hypothetical protein
VKRFALIALAGLSLCACAHSPTPATIHLDSGKSLIDAESALDAAAVAAQAAVTAHATTAAQNAKIASLTAPCPVGVTITTQVALASCPVVGFLALARQAYAASDTASFAALTANLVSLTTQLATTHS